MITGVIVELTGGESGCEGAERTATLAADDGFAAVEGAADRGRGLSVDGSRGRVFLAEVSANFERAVAVGFVEIVLTDSEPAVVFCLAVGGTRSGAVVLAYESAGFKMVGRMVG
jgi:hypothetical protein